MPFKQKVIPHLDQLINDAKDTNSVNIVYLNEDDKLIGENTDVYGLQAGYFNKVIEKSVKQFLETYKIIAKKDKKNIGIWVHQKKIAAIGIRVSRWVAYHGCSINISNDLNQYLKIIPCGLNNKKVTSIFKEKRIKPVNYENRLAEIFVKNIYQI